MLLVALIVDGAFTPAPSPRGREWGEGSPEPPYIRGFRTRDRPATTRLRRRTLTPALSLGERGPEVWRYAGEVRALVEFQGEPIAATAAGVFVRRKGRWVALGTGAPAALVALTTEAGDLVGTDAAQRGYRLRGDQWRPEGTRAAGMRTRPALDAPPPGSKGAFLSATTSRDVVQSFWGDTHLWRFGDPKKPERWIERPPSEGDYALLVVDKLLFAGTPDGVFAFDGQAWRKESLPGELPLVRPHGIAAVGSRWVVGGLQGLWMGAPGRWEEVGRVPVRQILGDGPAVWVLYGNGALDKLEPALDRQHPDVLHGAAKRPWGSCLGWSVDGTKRSLLIGGDGGWIEKQGETFVERYPAGLRGQVVTAIVGAGAVRYVGTQKGGLFRFSGSRMSVFNPGNGLKDPWITALSLSKLGMVIATAGGGLFSLRADRVSGLSSPSLRPRHLALWGGQLVVGAMDGAWERTNDGWRPLAVQGEEVTALGGASVATASGIYFFRE